MILVMAGTTEGVELAKGVKEKGIPLVACAVTKYGGELLAAEGIDVIIGAQDVEGLVAIINRHKITCLVDCTHPYAQRGSENAIEACTYTSIDYIRYERREGDIQGCTVVSSYLEATKILNTTKGNILLTIGSNNLEIFIKKLDNPARIIARVLPTPSVLVKCAELDLQPQQIIAIKGPYSKDLNKALLQHYDCKVLVTKDSGEIGGLNTKLEAARELGITSIVIARPEISYPKVFNNFDEIIKFLGKYNYLPSEEEKQWPTSILVCP